MASFDAVNYSLRPSKCIQRQIVFDSVRLLQTKIGLERLVYVGLGSIWFTDFVLAHKLLGIKDMVSIECHDVGFLRAQFNSPYATVRVRHGSSSDVIPTLYADAVISNRPWMVWLDYDSEFGETMKDDIVSIIENAPDNSILLTTFNGRETLYGHARDRPGRLRELFRSVVPDDLSIRACKDERMQETLADFTMDLMKSIAADLYRPGGFVPAFRVIYKDTSPMVTVGGVLPAREEAGIANAVVDNKEWLCRPHKPIIAPHLTMREATILQSCLPSAEKLTRDLVKGLGFDLEEEQIEAFETYYRQYPAYAQIFA